MGVPVEDKPIDAQAELEVAQGLERIGILRPVPELGAGGVGFGGGDILAVDVGGGSGFLGVVDRRLAGPVFADPEFAHGHIGVAFALQLIGHSRQVDADGLGVEAQMVFMGQPLQDAVVVLRHQIREGAPEIPKKTLGGFLAVDHPAGQGQQPALEIVAPAALELIADEGSPVFAAGLPAIEQDVTQAVPHLRRIVGDDRPQHALLEVRGHSHSDQLIAFQPDRGGRRRVVHDAGRGVPDAHHRPIAWRRVPVRPPSEVHDGTGRNDIGGGKGRRGKLADRPVRRHAGLGVGLIEPGACKRDVGEGELGAAGRHDGQPQAVIPTGDFVEGGRAARGEAGQPLAPGRPEVL